MADNIIKPKNVNDQQWNQALELYNMAKSKGDRYPELTVAQAALETGWFKSPAGRYNYFGQKASKGQEGSVKSTREVSGGASYMTQAKFRDYGNLGEAVDDRLTKWGKKYQGAGNVEDAIGTIWKYNPKTGSGEGYASDPQYGPILKNILGSMGVKTSDTGNVNAGTTTRPDAGIDYQSLTPEQKAYFDAQVAQYHNIREAEKSKEDAEADKAKAEIAQKQKEQAFMEEMKERSSQKAKREEIQQAPQFDGSAYRVDQQQMPTVQYSQLPETTFKDGGEKGIPRVSPEARSMGDAGVRFGNKFSTSIGANLRDKNIRTGASYNNGNFSTDINYTKGLDNTSSFSGNASYNPGKYNIDLSYDKGPEGNRNLSAGAGYNGENLSGNVRYNQDNQDRSLSGDVRYGAGNFSGSLGTNFTLGKDFNPNVRGDIGYQNRNLSTSIGAEYNRETGFEPSIRATYSFEDGGEIDPKSKKKPLYVESKNDPRYKAYQDSTSAYNTSIRFKNKQLKNIEEALDNKSLVDRLITGGKDDIIKVKTKESWGKYPGDIKPIASYNFKTPIDSDSEFASEVFGGYDVLKKPQQPVIVKPIANKQTAKTNSRSKIRNPTEKEIKEWSDPGFRLNSVTDYFDPVTKKVTQSWFGDMTRNEQAIKNNLQPAGLVQNGLNTNTVTIQQPVRIPQYYDIEDYTHGSTSYSGNQSNYRTDDLSTLSEQSPNNTRKITPRYQDGGEIEGRRFNPKKKQRSRLGYFAEGGVSIEDEAIDYNQEVSDVANEIDPVKKTPVNYKEVREGTVRDAIPTFNRQKIVIDVKPKVVPVPYTEKRETYTVERDAIPSFRDNGIQKILGDKKEQENLAKQGKEKWEALKKIDPDVIKALGKSEIMETQRKLYDLGYDLGNFGKEKNGIDGIIGGKTKAALAEYKKTGGPAQGDLTLEQEERIARLKQPKTNALENVMDYVEGKTEQLVGNIKVGASKLLPHNLQYDPKLDTVGSRNDIEGGNKYLLDKKSLADIRKEKNISFLQVSENKSSGNFVLPLQLKDRVVNSTNPQGYGPDYEKTSEGGVSLPFFDRLTSEESKTKQVKRFEGKQGDVREDIFRMYSGLPQKFDTFTVSSFKAGKGSDTNVTFKNPEDVADYVKIAATHTDLFKKLANGEITPETIAKDKLSGKKGGDKINKAGFRDPKNAMWNATFGVDFDKKGNPYLSFYDNWDLKGKDDVPIIKSAFGKPIEIYDRIPLTKELVKHLARLSHKEDNAGASDAVPTDDKSLIEFGKKIAQDPAVKREYDKMLSKIKERYQ